MEHSDTIKEIAPAFVAAQAKIEGATKDANNPHFDKKYADLASVMNACKAALNDNGIAIMQTPEAAEPGKLAVLTTLLHRSGEWFRATMVMPLPRNDPQGYGSAMTYARRYSLSSMVGVCPEDDDGNAASGDGKGQQQASRPAPQRPSPAKTVAPKGATPDPLTDVTTFRREMHAAFVARSFTDLGEKLAAGAIFKAFDVAKPDELTLEQRHTILGQVREGKADKYKDGIVEPAQP